MIKILLIGANSFVGRNYINFSRNKNVREISLFDLEPEEIDFSYVDVVIHLAAIVHQSKEIPENVYFEINRDLCLKVAENAKKAGVNHFIFLSTVKVYGNSVTNFGPIRENSPCNPIDPYGKSKHEAELGLKLLENDKFTVTIVRTPLVYGEGVKANMLSMLKLVDRSFILPFGKVQNRRSFTFVENMVAYIDRIIETKTSGTFIAMDESPLSTTELINYISSSLEKEVYLFRVPAIVMRIAKLVFPGIIDRLYGSLEFDNKKTLEILDFKPPFQSKDGIKRMVEAFKKTKIQ